ncbi:cupin domain-containing protein [Roseococcus sp.]|uniref:cupin domain-containing protein n=1 Tax=Roseococcus sp. TaxID=2109646 RepID=UPI003BA8A5EB
MSDSLRCRAPAVPVTLIDDDKVRVIRWEFEPGAETGFHRHGWLYVVVPMMDGTLLIEYPDGTTSTSELKAGVAYHRIAGAEHNVINAGPATLHFVETEVKAFPG